MKRDLENQEKKLKEMSKKSQNEIDNNKKLRQNFLMILKRKKKRIKRKLKNCLIILERNTMK